MGAALLARLLTWGKAIPLKDCLIAGAIAAVVGLDFYRVHHARVDQRDTDIAEFTASSKAAIDAAKAEAVEIQAKAHRDALTASQEAYQRQRDAAVYYNALQGAFNAYSAAHPLPSGCVFDPVRLQYANQKRPPEK